MEFCCHCVARQNTGGLDGDDDDDNLISSTLRGSNQKMLIQCSRGRRMDFSPSVISA